MERKTTLLSIRLLQLLFVVVMVSNCAFAQSMRIDSVISKEGNSEFIFKGYAVAGQRTGTWTGTDVATDSIKYYLIYENGFILKRYFIHPIYGPQLEFAVSSELDTLKEYTWGDSGRLMQESVWKIVSDSLLKTNCLNFCAKEEGAVTAITRYTYTYNYFDVAGMLHIYQSNYGGDNVQHYYYNNEFVCTLMENGKCVKGSKKKYDQIMRGRKK